MTGAAFTKLKKLPPPVLSVVVVVVSCVAFNLVDYGYFVSVTVAKSVYSSRGILQAAAYLVSYVVAVTGIVVVLFSREAIARWAGLVLVTLFIALELCCRQVTGENIGFIHVNVALSQTEFIGEFLSSYRASVAKAIGVALVIAAVLYALVRLTKLRFHVSWIGLIPVSSVLIYAVLWKTVAFTDFYPSPLRIPVLAAYASLNSLYTGPRQPVELTPKAGVGPRVLILIVDESVRGDYLGINGSTRDTTRYLASVADRLVNFGIASAATNMSSGTNIILQSGLRADQCPDREQEALKVPSIFQYAQAAGYRTCFLDGQSSPGKHSNFMTEHDFESIDVFYSVTADEQARREPHRRDPMLALEIKALIAQGDRVFIWVNKYGAHFHYEHAYPPEERLFTPTMPRHQPIGTSKLEQVENSYSNAIVWSVDRFFEMLLPFLDLEETLLLYTSDHGQSLKEGKGISTHADRNNPPSSQANVPLFGFGSHLRRRLPDGVSELRDRMSHFQIFPTLLVLMGYEESEVRGRFGAPLWVRPDEPRIFLSGDLFGRGIVGINEF